VVVFLAAAINFGHSFVNNSPAPLQQEIQSHMGIKDSEFNAFYSIKSLSSMIPPFALTVASGRFSVKQLLMSFSISVAVGQAMFTVGLQY
jgi:predicted MFS family arabinose efflux permease